MRTCNVKSISEYCQLRNLPKPEHPLICIVDYAAIQHSADISEVNWTMDFYFISVKRGIDAKLKYGQQQYDFNEGIMFFIAPGQVFRIEPQGNSKEKRSGWILLIHPDFLWSNWLAKDIKQYDFFNYTVHEALFLSGKEEMILNGLLLNIRQEYHSNIDKFSQGIIISQLETLLNYSERFYQRQFITRKKANHQILDRLEELLNNYFDSDDLIEKGLPTVEYLSLNLNVSAAYLRSLLNELTGQGTQQLIHNKIIEKAKEKLSTTTLSVSEIAYGLGFEHSQSFNRLFKAKTAQSPLAFRQAFS